MSIRLAHTDPRSTELTVITNIPEQTNEERHSAISRPTVSGVGQVPAVDVEDVGEVLSVLVRLGPLEAALTAQRVHTVPQLPAASPQSPDLLPPL